MASLVLTDGPPSGGTERTIQLANKHKKRYLLVDLAEETNPDSVSKWSEENEISTLNKS